MKKKKLKLRKKVFFRFIVSTILIIIMFILFYYAYFIYTNNRKVEHYNKNSTGYSFISVSEMSEEFALIGNRQLHFVKDNNNIYVVAINKRNIKKYQSIIDYTYGKTKDKKIVKIYGYPIKEDKNIKELVIKYVNKFLSYEEKIDVNSNNYSKYFSSTYLDTEVKESYRFNYVVFLLFLMVIIILLLFIRFYLFKRINKRSFDENL